MPSTLLFSSSYLIYPLSSPNETLPGTNYGERRCTVPYQQATRRDVANLNHFV